MRRSLAVLSIVAIIASVPPGYAAEITFKVVVNRGADLGQNFGSLFEAANEDGSLVVGAATSSIRPCPFTTGC
jgi:hypothetical protein